MSTPRSIEFADMRVGDKMRAERSTGAIRAVQGRVKRRSAAHDVDQIWLTLESEDESQVLIANREPGWSLTLLSRPAEVCPVGSLWQDPKNGSLWVRRDTNIVTYGWFGGTSTGEYLDSSGPVQAAIIDRLVPWAGEQS